MAEDVVSIVVLDIYEDGFNDQGKAIEWVTWAKRGSGYSMNAASTTDKVERIRKTNPNLWVHLEPAYKQWKLGQSVPDGETSLAASALFNKQQIELLKTYHITSVEQLAKLGDTEVQNIIMGGRELRTKARHFVQHKNGDGRIAQELAQRDAVIEAMQARLAELEAEKNVVDAPRRGRPPKNQEPADEAEETAA